MSLTFEEYQNRTQETAIYPKQTINLDSKVVGSLSLFKVITNDLLVLTTTVKKSIRDHNGGMSEDKLLDINAGLIDILNKIHNHITYNCRLPKQLEFDTTGKAITNNTEISGDKIAIVYTSLGILDESLELYDKISSDSNHMNLNDVSKEIGDVLWYLSQLSTELGLSLENIANNNLEKLKSRKERNVLQGNGDNR